MERENKERKAEVMRKIRKVWLPFLLCVLIVVNLMVVPKIFENNGVVFQSVSMPIGVEEGSIQLLPPVAVRVDKDKENDNVGRNDNDEMDVNDDNDNDNVVVISKESSDEVGKESVVEQNDNNNNNVNENKKGGRRTQHVQHRGFRLFLFLLIVIIVMLIFLMIIYNNEKNYEYSQSRANIYSSQLNNGVDNTNNNNLNNNNNNGYSKLPDEYYDNI